MYVEILMGTVFHSLRVKVNLYTLDSQVTQNHWGWIRKNWVQDAKETRSIIEKLNKNIDLLIVDHYGIDLKWESYVRLGVDHIMVIDE